MYRFHYEHLDERTGAQVTEITIDKHNETSLEDLFQTFKDFLNASGYCIRDDIGILYESDEDNSIREDYEGNPEDCAFTAIECEECAEHRENIHDLCKDKHVMHGVIQDQNIEISMLKQEILELKQLKDYQLMPYEDLVNLRKHLDSRGLLMNKRSIKTAQQPDLVCIDCGLKYAQRMPEGWECCTFNENKCGVCRKEVSVTSPRNYGYLKPEWMKHK